MLGENKKEDKSEFVNKLVSKLADTPGRVTSSWVYFGSHFQDTELLPDKCILWSQ